MLKMYLYNTTLHASTAVTHAIFGHYSGTEHLEIAISSGKTLSILRLNSNIGKVDTLLSVDIFGTIHSMVKLSKEYKDYLVISSDCGKIIILEYTINNVFRKIYQTTFAIGSHKQPVRGLFLATDPKGRALLVSSIENEKTVYKINRYATVDCYSKLSVSNCISSTVFDVVGLESRNSLFACLEVTYKEGDDSIPPQNLVFYEYDVKNNYIVRKHCQTLKEHGNHLIAVPGRNKCPSGVLICSKNFITYANFKQSNICCPIPKRNNLYDLHHESIFICSVACKISSYFFVLAQTENGDIFKITLEIRKDVSEIKLKYFDSISIASAMCISKTGYLFVACDFGNHFLFSYDLNDDDELEFSSARSPENDETFIFEPRYLKHLVFVDELKSLSPIIDCHVTDLMSDVQMSQIYVTCGYGSYSSLRMLKYRFCESYEDVSELNIPYEYGKPNAIWSVKKEYASRYHAYFVLSCEGFTAVLSSDRTDKIIENSAFNCATPTLLCAQMGCDIVVQVYPEGVRRIQPDKVIKWVDPDKGLITTCTSNQQQLVVVLNKRILVYFKMDVKQEILEEYRCKKEFLSDVLCLALEPCGPRGLKKSRCLVVGFIDSVLILSLNENNCWTYLYYHKLEHLPQSLALEQVGTDYDGNRQSILYLNIGLQNGFLLRILLDDTNNFCFQGILEEKILGSKPVKLYKIHLYGTEAIIAVSDWPWIGFIYQSKYHFMPLLHENVDSVSEFSNEQYPNSIIVTCGKTKKILALGKFDSSFSQVVASLQYTPRQCIVHSKSKCLITIEADCNAHPDKLANIEKTAESGFSFVTKPTTDYRTPAVDGIWNSLIRVFNPDLGKTINVTSLNSNKLAPLALCLVKVSKYNNEEFLFVSMGRTMSFSTPLYDIIQCYKVLNNGNDLLLIYETAIEEAPVAICPFKGNVLMGVGNILRLYDITKTRLQQICEKRYFSKRIVTINAAEDVVIVGDAQKSIFFVHYRSVDNWFTVFAHDTNPRWLTCTCVLDNYTVAVADEQGNICVIRLPMALQEKIEEASVTNRLDLAASKINPSLQKVQNICNFHVGDVVLSLQKAALIPGRPESLIYATVSGAIGILIPFTSIENYNFFRTLEQNMRSENITFCVIDHLHYRSRHFSVRNVIDGDLCQKFDLISLAEQIEIAANMNCDLHEISKRIEAIRAEPFLACNLKRIKRLRR